MLTFFFESCSICRGDTCPKCVEESLKITSNCCRRVFCGTGIPDDVKTEDDRIKKFDSVDLYECCFFKHLKVAPKRIDCGHDACSLCVSEIFLKCHSQSMI